MKHFNNNIQLLIEYKMMLDNWSAWTEDSYISVLLTLTDNDIEIFMNKDIDEINIIKCDVNNYYLNSVKTN